MATFTCQGCGEEFAYVPKPGPKRKWCSEKCRKSQYHGTCIDCGGKTDGVASGYRRVPERCRDCQRNLNAERNAALEEMWCDGVPTVQIAKRLGMTPEAVRTYVDRQRQGKARDLPLRRQRNREDWPLVERMVRAGATNREIGEAIGGTADDAASRIQNMRAAGIDLPRRT